MFSLIYYFVWFYVIFLLLEQETLCLTEVAYITPPPLLMRKRSGRDRIVVSTSRCGRDNPGSNPGHGINRSQAYSIFVCFLLNIFILST